MPSVVRTSIVSGEVWYEHTVDGPQSPYVDAPAAPHPFPYSHKKVDTQSCPAPLERADRDLHHLYDPEIRELAIE